MYVLCVDVSGSVIFEWTQGRNRPNRDSTAEPAAGTFSWSHERPVPGAGEASGAAESILFQHAPRLGGPDFLSFLSLKLRRSVGDEPRAPNARSPKSTRAGQTLPPPSKKMRARPRPSIAWVDHGSNRSDRFDPVNRCSTPVDESTPVESINSKCSIFQRLSWATPAA